MANAVITDSGVMMATTATTAQRRSHRNVSEPVSEVSTAEWPLAMPIAGASAFARPIALNMPMNGEPCRTALGVDTR